MARIDEAVRVGKALSDPTRVRILAALEVRPLCVCELTHLLRGGQPAVSRHLGILRDAGLVEDVRDGKWVDYRLRRPPAGSAAAAVAAPLLRSLRRDPALAELRRRARTVDRLRI